MTQTDSKLQLIFCLQTERRNWGYVHDKVSTNTHLTLHIPGRYWGVKIGGKWRSTFPPLHVRPRQRFNKHSSEKYREATRSYHKCFNTNNRLSPPLQQIWAYNPQEITLPCYNITRQHIDGRSDYNHSWKLKRINTFSYSDCSNFHLQFLTQG